MALFEPTPVWEWVKRRRAHRWSIATLLAIALLGGLVVAGATEIGVRWFTTDWNFVAGYRPQPDRGWHPFLALWLSAAALPIAQGLGGAWLLPLYGRARDWAGGLAVGVVGSLPIYASAPALIMLPGILLLCVAFLVSCAWWGSGARQMLGVPIGESSDHVVASIIVGTLAVTVVSAVLSLGASAA